MAAAAIQVGAQLGSGIIKAIFGGMAQRAAEARNENVALQSCIVALDQGLAKLNEAYNAGQISENDCAAEVNSIWQWYWQIMTPNIQPNRDGCNSGSGCPGSATQYAGSNGEPNGYCKGNIGATCCVGCGPLRLSLANVTNALESGGGVSNIAIIVGNKYGVQTRPAYTLNWAAPRSTIITKGSPILHSILGGGSGAGAVDTSGGGSAVSAGSFNTGGITLSPMTLLLGAIGALGIVVIALVSRK
jgi:hypothetical protein